MTTITCCQTKQPQTVLNLDFERSNKEVPDGWSNFGSSSYTISLDSIHVKSGRYSTSIVSKSSSDYKALAFTLPDNYEGKKITLTGYIKTENVSEGYAGLWMRIDPSIAFDNMNNNGVKGTTDWRKYEITLNMNPSKTKQIVFGGLLVGKGKMWLDDFKVSIDGKNIKDIKPLARKIFPAENDKEFDSGSQLTQINLDKNKIENLKTLGLIWGFLKYYHPSIAKGNYNWDYELFRILPKVLNTTNTIERDAILVE